MQNKRYVMPSARSRTHIKRNILNTLEKQENQDESWLNDTHVGSPTVTAQMQEHTVCYEDIPTMPLSVFNSSPKLQAIPAVHEEASLDEDKTIQFNKYRKDVLRNPLDALLHDETISVITALSPKRIYIERDGIVQQTPLRFSDEQHMLCVIEHLLQTAGQSVSTQSPLTGVRLPDGSLLTVALPPRALSGPALTIRKYAKNMATLSALVQQGSISQAMANVLCTCVQARLNIVVCGPVGSGRTTLLNALCVAIPKHERIATIEDTPELRLSQPQVIALQPCTAACITTGDLVTHVGHMHVNRVIIGECHSNEAEKLLQSMYNGLDGVMTTMYGHSVKDCLTRLETLCLLHNGEYSAATPKLIRSQIAQSINIVVSLSPEHKITNIAEVQSADEGPLKIQSLFHYQDGKRFAAKNPQGSFEASGFYPEFVERCKALGISLLRDTFMA